MFFVLQAVLRFSWSKGNVEKFYKTGYRISTSMNIHTSYNPHTLNTDEQDAPNIIEIRGYYSKATTSANPRNTIFVALRGFRLPRLLLSRLNMKGTPNVLHFQRVSTEQRCTYRGSLCSAWIILSTARAFSKAKVYFKRNQSNYRKLFSNYRAVF